MLLLLSEKNRVFYDVILIANLFLSILCTSNKHFNQTIDTTHYNEIQTL